MARSARPTINTMPLFCNDRLRVEIFHSEMRMSHWIDAPRVLREADRTWLLDLADSVWHLVAAREDRDELVLSLQKYPDATVQHELRIRASDERCRFDGEPMTLEAARERLR